MRVKLESVAVESRETYKGSQSGIPIVGLEHLTPQDVNLTEWNVDTDNTFSKMFRKGQVLFGRRRAYLKKAAVAPCDGICSGDITVIAAKPDALAPELLPFIIQNDRFFDFAIEKSAGSLSPRAKWEHLREFEFDLPPMDEQRRLADVLWAFDETRQAYKKLLKSTDELVKSQFVEMFGELESDIKGFRRVTLKEACELNPRKSADTKLESGLEVSFVPMQAVSEQGEVDSSATRPYDEVKNGFTYFAENDVLLAKITPCLENGKGGIARSLSNGVGFGSTEFHVMRPIDGLSAPRWLYHITTFDRFRTEAAENMTGTAGQRRIPTAYLEKYTVPLPPLDLQTRFAAFAEAADKSKFELNRALDELDAAYKALVRERLG